MKFESENIEYKLTFKDDLYKEVIAFMNSSGGDIYIGISDDYESIGVNDVDEEYLRVTNGIRDAIMPDATMFVKYKINEDKVIHIKVLEGSYKPYYLKSKGLKPSGVYVRQGASSVQASNEQIRAFIKESDGDIFEEMRSMNQELSFNSAQKIFKHYNIEFSKEKYRTLGIITKDANIYSNLALIISDQCVHTTKVAVFSDDANTKFLDSKEFNGSVFDQLDGAFSYLSLCNKINSTFKGLERIEKSDYPEEALREALLNALVHRDYSFSGSIIININSKEMEFISLGGLLPGLYPDDIRSGISQPRNMNLANIFYRLHFIESYGTGIRKIYKLYENCHNQPRIEVTPNSFKIVLPNMNYITQESSKKNITKQMQKILDYIDENGQITDNEIQELLNLKKTRAFTVAKQMRDNGLIRVEGYGSDKNYLKI